MLLTKTQKVTLTLLTHLILAFTFSATVGATDFTHRGIADYGHKRIVKKRSPFPDNTTTPSSNDRAADKNVKSDNADTGVVDAGAAVLHGAIGAAAAAPSLPADNSTASVSASDSLSASASASLSDSLSASASASASVLPSSNATASNSSISVSASATPSFTPSSQPTLPPPSNTITPGAAQQSTFTSTQQVTATSAPKNDAANNNDTSGGLSSKNTIITVLIVVGASIAGVAIIWTVFRKWKLGHSSKFDARLQPIDWQPTHSDEGEFRPHRNSGMSYRSGYGSTSGHGNLQPVPDHDFTAGSSHMAPVGGYADLARGPSPQPYMQENMRNGPGLASGGNYNNGVPLHHQGGYNGQY